MGCDGFGIYSLTSFKKRLIFWQHYQKLELIQELTGWIIASTEIISSNTICPLSKESDNPSEKVRKTGGDLYDIKKTLVTTTETFVKEGNTDMVDKKK